MRISFRQGESTARAVSRGADFASPGGRAPGVMATADEAAVAADEQSPARSHMLAGFFAPDLIIFGRRSPPFHSPHADMPMMPRRFHGRA